MEKRDPTGESYEALPYERLVHRFTHPDRIALAARLVGLDPAPVPTARVLELGCASGDNLVGMAFGLPHATFVGVDVSPRQVEAGRRRVGELGLPNVSFRVGDLRDVDESWGTFDYVIAHGVFSWVSEPVRRRLLEVCRDRLGPAGVAFVSYNALPGWRFRRLVRDVLCAGAAGARAPEERARLARERLALVAANVFDPASPWGRYLADRAEELEGDSDAELLHDFVESENEAFSLREVVDRAKAAGLDYVGDAQEPFASDAPLAPGLRRTLDALPDDVEREMLLDVLRERTLRQSLFAPAGGMRRRPVDPTVVGALHAASQPRLESAEAQPRFVSDGRVARESDPRLSGAMRALWAAWPATVPVSVLLDGCGLPSGGNGVEASALGDDLLRLQREGVVELRTTPLSCGSPLSSRPRASALARLQAGEGSRVTSLRHRNVDLDPLAVEVIVLLDGSRTPEEVATACGWPPAVVRAVIGRLLRDSLLAG